MSRSLVARIYDLAWPVLIAQLAVMAYAVVDTIMAGRYATDDLAAVGIGASVYFSVFVGLMGVLLAMTPIVAQLKGAGRHEEIGEQVRQAMWLVLALAALSIVIFRYPDPLLRLSQPPAAVERKVRAYLAIAAYGAPAGLAFRLFASYTTAVSLPRIMMVLNLLGLALKVPLNWMLVFGHWGAPEMGAAGCALATAIVSWLICALAWLHVATWRAYREHRVFARWSWPRARDLYHLLALGLPIGGTFLVDVTSFTFMALFIARLGAATSAAHQIAANVAAVMYMVPLATASAVGILVGQAIGARNFAQARATGLTGLALGLGIAATSACLLVLGAHRIAAFYSDDPDVRFLAAGLLLLVAGYHMFDAVQSVTVNALRGYKRAVVPLLVNAAGMWVVGLAGGVAIGLTHVAALEAIGVGTPLGVRGFWIAAMIGMAVATVGIVIYFLAISSPRRPRHDASMVPARLRRWRRRFVSMTKTERRA
jgi:MATE family multidrug resistance protein